ncbi:MAG: GNAT family N-acetyltransferase [Candidatus Bathyarchaeota archaeon]|jgi:GNAT superfamily N-acetyltransferase
MLKYRTIHIKKDRDILLELHCRINYESETPYARKVSYEQYREKWLKTSQPESYLQHLAKTMKDKRAIAEILEDNGKTVGYLWVTFTDIEGYDMTIAEIMDFAVVPEYQHQGIGAKMMKYIEEMAKKKGATLLRSATGIENIASQKLHEKSGFKSYHILYEKGL